MKVLQDNLGSVEPLNVVCVNCTSVLETVPTDFRYTDDQRDGCFLSCTCPVCNYPVSVSGQIVSHAFLLAARRSGRNGT